MAHAIPMSFFQTTDVPTKKKYEAFRESIGVIFEVAQPQVAPDKFDAWIKSQLIDELLLVECVTVGQRFIRPAQMIGRDNVDHFLVQIFYSGFTKDAISKEERICNNGKILILDATKPWEAFNSDFRNLTLVVPRRLLAPELIDEDLHHGRMIDSASNPFAEILIKYLVSLDETSEKIRIEDAHSLVRPSVDLVAAALNYKPGMTEKSFRDNKSSFRLAMRFRIKAFIDQMLNVSYLNPLHIQSEFNISAEFLSELFPQGVAEYFDKRKMEVAFRRLLFANCSGEAVEQIAHSLGYKSEMMFSIAFKKCYSFSPREIRNWEKKGLSFLETLGEKPGRIWEQWFQSL